MMSFFVTHSFKGDICHSGYTPSWLLSRNLEFAHNINWDYRQENKSA